MAQRAITSFTAHIETLGHAPVVTEGTVLADTDPIVLAHPTLFVNVDVFTETAADDYQPVPVKRRRGVKRPGSPKKS